MSSIPGWFVMFTCSDLSPVLQLGEDSHPGLEVRSGLFGWLVIILILLQNRVWATSLGLFYDRNVRGVFVWEGVCFVLNREL